MTFDKLAVALSLFCLGTTGFFFDCLPNLFVGVSEGRVFIPISLLDEHDATDNLSFDRVIEGDGTILVLLPGLLFQ